MQVRHSRAAMSTTAARKARASRVPASSACECCNAKRTNPKVVNVHSVLLSYLPECACKHQDRLVKCNLFPQRWSSPPQMRALRA
jgi:hypothetical protein